MRVCSKREDRVACGCVCMQGASKPAGTERLCKHFYKHVQCLLVLGFLDGGPLEVSYLKRQFRGRLAVLAEDHLQSPGKAFR